MGFFDKPQPAAQFKHGVLRRFLPRATGKLGRFGGRVVFFDGYAGPGHYKDGSRGSPAWAVEIAETMAPKRRLDCFFVERDKTYFQELQNYLTSNSTSRWRARVGDVADHLAEALRYADRVPLVAFLDPFGLTLPMTTIQKHLLGRSEIIDRNRRLGSPTDLIINFSLPALYRNWRRDVKGKPLEEKKWAGTVETLNAALGGSWWREIWESGVQDPVQKILMGYQERLCEDGWRSMAVPVSDHFLEGAPDYYLIFVTWSPHGIVVFNDACSNTFDEFKARFPRQPRLTEMLDDTPLFDADDEIDREVKANIVRLLNDRLYASVLNDIQTILGRAIGRARDKHIARAWKALANEGFAQPPKPALPVEKWVILRSQPV